MMFVDDEPNQIKCKLKKKFHRCSLIVIIFYQC